MWLHVGFALRRTLRCGLLLILDTFSPLKTAVSSDGWRLCSAVDARAASQFWEMLSWISKNWHALFTLFFFGVILKACFISKRKKRLLWMCKHWYSPVNVYVDTATNLPGEERLFIFIVYVGMACLDVVSRCLCTKRDFQASGLERMQDMLCPAPSLRCGMWGGGCCWDGIFWSQVHPESKHCHQVLISTWEKMTSVFRCGWSRIVTEFFKIKKEECNAFSRLRV